MNTQYINLLTDHMYLVTLGVKSHLKKGDRGFA